MNISTEKRTTLKGQEVTVITLKNEAGMEVRAMDLGCALLEINVPDKKGNVENVVLAHQDLDEYLTSGMYLGAVVGRTSGRVHKGEVTIEGQTYQLPLNDNGNTLHGGLKGFSKRIWNVIETGQNDTEAFVTFGYISPDGEENYPGTVMLEVTYTLTAANQLIIKYRGQSDKETLLNMTNHSYFNLSGDIKAPVLDHILQVHATHIAEIDEACIITGKLLDLQDPAHAAYNFNTPKTIGQDIQSGHPQLRGGYDNPWILDKSKNCCVVYHDPISGREMTVTTDRDAVVIYSMCYPEESVLNNGKVGQLYEAVCFETQALPIGYNQAFIEGSRLAANTPYETTTCFSFTCK